MSVCCECCVLPGMGLCDGPITRPEESYRVWCVWWWSWILDNEEALAHWGLLLHSKKTCNFNFYWAQFQCLNLWVVKMWKRAKVKWTISSILTTVYERCVIARTVFLSNVMVVHHLVTCLKRLKCVCLASFQSLSLCLSGFLSLATRTMSCHFFPLLPHFSLRALNSKAFSQRMMCLAGRHITFRIWKDTKMSIVLNKPNVLLYRVFHNVLRDYKHL
jgi:hypothetical protein